MRSPYQKAPEKHTKVSAADQHLVVTTVKGKVIVIYNYKSLLNSLDPLKHTECQMMELLRSNTMVISTDSNVLDLATFGNKIGIRLSKSIESRREDFLLLLDGRYLPDLKDKGKEVRLNSWVIMSPINRSVLGCGGETGGMVIDDYGVCLPGLHKCELPHERDL